MARPERNNVDYFPFYCEDGKKMFYLEETYGNDGFATFIKLLRELAKTDYHFLDLSKTTTTMFLSAKCKISKDILDSIINDLVDLDKFDAILWKENRIVWCQDFIDSIQDAYSKRNNKCISYEGLLLRLQSLGVRKPIKGKPKAPVNPQSIVKERKEEEIKELIVTFLSPKLHEVFNRWLEFRVELKKPVTIKSSVESLIKKFNSESLEMCIQVVDYSIENTYQGLLWDRFADASKPNPQIKPKFNSPIL
tara:strand:+ start:428 stop:1177 length:750 start_codon:yes stop_codon:yes gene_type:complete